MHMLSRKDLNAAEFGNRKGLWESVRRRLSQPTAKCKQMKRPFQSIGLICDSKASGRYTGLSLPRKVLGGLWIFLRVDQWSETTTRSKRQTNKMQHGELRTDRLSTSSSSSATPASPTSLPQEAVIPAQHPASTRSESTSCTVRRSPSHEPAETENTNKNGDNETVRWNPLRDLPEWLKEFTENLVDESVPAHGDAPASSSRESASESRGKVVSGKHSIKTHFSKNRNCDMCMRTKITWAPCRRRTGAAVPQTEHLRELITADHKVLSERCESRNNHRYPVVVQDLATQWIQSYPCKTKTSHETEQNLQKLLGAVWKAESHSHWQFVGIWQSLWIFFLESSYVNTSPFRNKWDYRKSSAQSERRDICGAIAVRSGWKNGGRIQRRVTAICEIYEISCQMGKHLANGDSSNHSKGQEFRLVRWSNITLLLSKTCRDGISSARRSVMHHTREESEKETFWGIGKDGRIWNPCLETQCERSVNAEKMVNKCYSRSQMEQSNCLEEIRFRERPP